MSKAKDIYYIIAYDISDPKRLRKVHRLVKEYAMALQHSVFIAPFSQSLLNEMVSRLKKIIAPSKDDVRIYPLSYPQTPEIYGKRKLPDGIFLNTIMDYQSQSSTQASDASLPFIL